MLRQQSGWQFSCVLVFVPKFDRKSHSGTRQVQKRIISKSFLPISSWESAGKCLYSQTNGQTTHTFSASFASNAVPMNTFAVRFTLVRNNGSRGGRDALSTPFPFELLLTAE